MIAGDVQRVLVAAPRGDEDQRADARGQQRRAEVVDRVAVRRHVQVQAEHDDEHRDDADRHVHVEDPAPRERLDEEAAEQRAGDRRDREHGADQAHVAAALARRHDLGDDRLRADHQAAGAEALQRAEGDQLAHRLAQARQQRAGEEDHDRGQEHGLAPVHVAELSVERRRRRGREQVGGDDPREVLEATEVADDRRQRRRDDRLVQRGQEHAQHQRAEHGHERAAGQHVAGLGGVAVGGAHARSPSCREWKTAPGASSWVSVPSATARAPASSSAPNTRTAHSVESVGENSPAAWPRSISARSGSPRIAAAVLARLGVDRELRLGRELGHGVALGDVQPRGAEPLQRVGGASLVQAAGQQGSLALLDGLGLDRADQRLARREVAVHRRAADAGREADLAHPDVRVLAQQARGDLDDAMDVARRVGAEIFDWPRHSRQHCSA